jgi:hypothetical protein
VDWKCGDQQWQSEQDREEHYEQDSAGCPAHLQRQRNVIGRSVDMKNGNPGDKAENDRPDLTPGGWECENDHRGDDSDGRPFAIRRERTHHAEHGLRHHRHRDHLQAVQPAAAERVAERSNTVGEQHQRNRRGEGEACPGDKRTGIAGAKKTDRDTDLGTGRTGQELRQRDQIGIRLFVEPFAVLDEFGAEIAEMRDRPAEGCRAKAEKT